MVGLGLGFGLGLKPWKPAADGGGGGGPEGSLIHMDFIAQTAWNDGEEVALSTLLGNDPAYDAAASTTTAFSMEDLEARGLILDKAAFIGDAKTLILAGATCVAEFDYESDAQMAVALHLTGGIFLMQWGIFTNDAFVGTNDGDVLINNVFSAPPGIRKLAFTFVPGDLRSELAAQGNETVVTSPEVSFFYEGHVGGAMHLNSHHYCRSFTIYPPLPDTSGLAALSAVS